MGIVRDVAIDGSHVTVTITPTFSGCPALDVMQDDIRKALRRAGVASVSVDTVLSPPWTSDWITDAGRAKLKAFGLAPPARHGGSLTLTFFDVVTCPRCDSADTTIKNSFGSTLCRSIWVCNTCQEPFEQFKPL
jgi:ring-1,2-phenylacetyl-CoA epoxidase subunit PaaD